MHILDNQLIPVNGEFSQALLKDVPTYTTFGPLCILRSHCIKTFDLKELGDFLINSQSNIV